MSKQIEVTFKGDYVGIYWTEAETWPEVVEEFFRSVKLEGFSDEWPNRKEVKAAVVLFKNPPDEEVK